MKKLFRYPHLGCIFENKNPTNLEVFFNISFLSLYYFAHINRRGHNGEISGDSVVSL